MTSGAPRAAWQDCDLPADAVELGRLGAPWGVRGAIKLTPYSVHADVLLNTDRWILRAPSGRFGPGFSAFAAAASVRVLSCRPQGTALVVEIDGVTDRNQADRLKGCGVWVSRSQFVPLQDGEFYWVDLIGSTVTNRQGLVLGVVQDMMATGPTSVLVVAAQGGEGDPAAQHLIPFVAQYVDDVDVAARAIRVDWQSDY